MYALLLFFLIFHVTDGESRPEANNQEWERWNVRRQHSRQQVKAWEHPLKIHVARFFSQAHGARRSERGFQTCRHRRFGYSEPRQ